MDPQWLHRPSVADASPRSDPDAFRSDDRRQSEFAADDCSVARAAACVRDEGGRATHGGDPVGRGHRGDEDVAVGEEVAILR